MSNSSQLDLEEAFTETLNRALENSHSLLIAKFPFLTKERQLSQQQNRLVSQFPEGTSQHRIITTALGIETIIEDVCGLFGQTNSLLEALSIALIQVHKVKQQLKSFFSREQLESQLKRLFDALFQAADSACILNPLSPFASEMVQIAKGQQWQEVQQSVYLRLKQQNDELRARLNVNDEKLIEMEIKFHRFLQESRVDPEDGLVGVMGVVSKNELRQLVQEKQLQIKKMNIEFSTQIQKYNIVYLQLKRELQEYRDYQNVDTVALVEKLQTQIVLLQEQNQREQLINQQLRKRLQTLDRVQDNRFSFKNTLLGQERSLTFSRSHEKFACLWPDSFSYGNAAQREIHGEDSYFVEEPSNYCQSHFRDGHSNYDQSSVRGNRLLSESYSVDSYE